MGLSDVRWLREEGCCKMAIWVKDGLLKSKKKISFLAKYFGVCQKKHIFVLQKWSNDSTVFAVDF